MPRPTNFFDMKSKSTKDSRGSPHCCGGCSRYRNPDGFTAVAHRALRIAALLVRASAGFEFSPCC